jgi:hypothetical protein
MSPETTLTCGPAGVLIDLSAGFFSPVCHFPSMACCPAVARSCPAAPSTEASSGHAIQSRLGELAISPAIPHANPVETALMPGRRTRDTGSGLALDTPSLSVLIDHGERAVPGAVD